MNPNKKISSFLQSLSIQQNADYAMAAEDETYRSGIIAEFACTFELAWKSIQAVPGLHQADLPGIGSPRIIIGAGYAAGIIAEDEVWLKMLQDRSNAFHRYKEELADEIVERIRTEYVPAFEQLHAGICSLTLNM